VGCGRTLKDLEKFLMTEAFHHSIFLHPDLRLVGMGITRVDERNRCGRGSYLGDRDLLRLSAAIGTSTRRPGR
jgi:hypothetical protein